MSVPEGGKPPITGTKHVLPFEQLSPDEFERLCVSLLERERYYRIGHFGSGGSDHGRDVVAYRNPEGGRPVYFQCKRRNELRAKDLLGDIDRVVELVQRDQRLLPGEIIFFVSVSVSAKLRDKVTGYCLDHGFDCQFWARTELNAKVRKHDGLVDEFFQISAGELRDARPVFQKPHRIPRPPLRFVNRTTDMRKLDKVTSPPDIREGPIVAVLQGMHGVGKSAIGKQWAARNRGRFPAGDLFANFSRRERAASLGGGDVIAQFLRDLGVEARSIPSSIEDRAALFGEITRDLQLLVMLDDVEFAAQVLPTLPMGSGSVVVVTSHYRMEELFQEGAVAVDLEPFTDDDARELLEALVGEERIRNEPEAVQGLIRLCGGLPIALCVCAGRLVSDRTRTVDWLVRRIEAEPLVEFAGSASNDIGAVLDFTYSDLTPASAVLYRRLGVYPGETFVLEAVAALAGLSKAAARQALDDLHRAHLVELTEPDRYRLHDLVRAHTKACSKRVDSDDERDGAVARLVDWFYLALRRADWAIVQDRIRLSDDVVVTADDAPEFASPTEAFQWFAAERPNISGVLQAAFDREWHGRVWQIAEALWPLCASHKYFSEWIRSHDLAIESALVLADPAVEARFRSQLARAYAEVPDHERAAAEMSAAHRAVERCHHDALAASVTEFGGVCLLRAGDPRAALVEFERARAAFASVGVPRGVALQDFHIGWARVESGDAEGALPFLHNARVALTELGDEISVGRVGVQTGKALVQQRRFTEAEAELMSAVDIMDRFGIVFEQAEAYEEMARAATASSRPDAATTYLRQAYRLYQKLGHAKAGQLATAIEG